MRNVWSMGTKLQKIGEIGSHVLLYSIVTIMHCIFFKKLEKDFECFYHDKMINVWEDRYAHADLNIIWGTHALKHHTVAQNMYNFNVPIKIF
jgi:hypothetical protein